MGEVIRLNVGGVIYSTTRATLGTYPESMLGVMFNGEFGATMDEDGNYFIDRDGDVFKHVLNFLRSNKLTLPQDFTDLDLLISEADFYQIQPLIEALRGVKPGKKEPETEKLLLEIFEVRYDEYLHVPTKSNKVTTLVIGRKDILCTFPFGVAKWDDLKELADSEKENSEHGENNYGELELRGRTARMQLTHHLCQHGWQREISEMSTANFGSPINHIQHSVREVWSRHWDTDLDLELHRVKRLLAL